MPGSNPGHSFAESHVGRWGRGLAMESGLGHGDGGGGPFSENGPLPPSPNFYPGLIWILYLLGKIILLKQH